jgi:hypothetical protein
MAQTTFSGPVKSLAGFISAGVSNSVTTAVGKTLTVANDAGKQIYYTSTATATFTLPAVNTSSPSDPTDPNQSNNYGATFEFVLSTTVTGSFIVKVANASDTIVGTAIIGEGTTSVAVISTATASDTITLNGTTTGGVGGANIKATVIGANRYKVEVVSGATGALATPFSSTVS